MCHTVAQIRRQELPMCLAEVIVRPLTMRLLDPWPLHRTHRLQHYCNPDLQGGCRSNRQQMQGFVLVAV